MPNPFLIPNNEPALIAFSGGRTSAYMLHHTVDAYDGKLPSNVFVAFFNTGKEMPQTLDFVRECGRRMGVHINWLEYDGESMHSTKIVTYRSAARKGEPYAALIKDKQLLPNPVARFCTQELKIRRGRNYMHRIMGFESWFNVVGLRFDESRRWMNFTSDKKERFTVIFPLVAAETTVADVSAFWSAADYDLRLPNVNGTTPLGNCDLCFLKGTKKITSLIRENPALADWWIEQESKTKARLKMDGNGAVFRMGVSYQQMVDMANSHTDLLSLADDPIADCMCSD